MGIRWGASPVAWATTSALTGAAWLVWLAGQPSAGAAFRHGPHGLVAWAVTSLLALPVIVGSVWVAVQLGRVLRSALRVTPSTGTTHPMLLSSTAGVGLGTGWHLRTSFAGADPPEVRLPVSVVPVSPATLVSTLVRTAVLAGSTTRSPRLRTPSPGRLAASAPGATQRSFFVQVMDVLASPFRGRPALDATSSSAKRPRHKSPLALRRAAADPPGGGTNAPGVPSRPSQPSP